MIFSVQQVEEDRPVEESVRLLVILEALLEVFSVVEDLKHPLLLLFLLRVLLLVLLPSERLELVL